VPETFELFFACYNHQTSNHCKQRQSTLNGNVRSDTNLVKEFKDFKIFHEKQEVLYSNVGKRYRTVVPQKKNSQVEEMNAQCVVYECTFQCELSEQNFSVKRVYLVVVPSNYHHILKL
jgi:hypothetical protein